MTGKVSRSLPGCRSEKSELGTKLSDEDAADLVVVVVVVVATLPPADVEGVVDEP